MRTVNICALAILLLSDGTEAVTLSHRHTQHQRNVSRQQLAPVDNVYAGAGVADTWNPKIQVFSLLQEGAKNAALEIQSIKDKQQEKDEDNLYNPTEDLAISNMLQVSEK